MDIDMVIDMDMDMDMEMEMDIDMDMDMYTLLWDWQVGRFHTLISQLTPKSNKLASR